MIPTVAPFEHCLRPPDLYTVADDWGADTHEERTTTTTVANTVTVLFMHTPSSELGHRDDGSIPAMLADVKARRKELFELLRDAPPPETAAQRIAAAFDLPLAHSRIVLEQQLGNLLNEGRSYDQD